MSDAWYVGILRTGSEGKIHRRCEDAGIESYLPMLRTKGARRRGEPGREAKERPALAGYLPIKAATVEAPEAREMLYQEAEFYDFIRDITNRFATMPDEALDPLRAMENSGETVQYYSGPSFYLGEIVVIAYNNPFLPMGVRSRKGEVVDVKNGRYCLEGHDFTTRMWFSGFHLAWKAV